jgi:hypothetical protein
MTLNRERLGIIGADSLMLVVYHRDVGSSDADKLALLTSAALLTSEPEHEASGRP